MTAPLQFLSRLQLRLLRQLADGQAIGEIAEAEGLLVASVRDQIAAAMQILGADTPERAALMVHWHYGGSPPLRLTGAIEQAKQSQLRLGPAETGLLQAHVEGADQAALQKLLQVRNLSDAAHVAMAAGLMQTQLPEVDLDYLRHSLLGHTTEECQSHFKATSRNAVMETRVRIYRALGASNLCGAVAAAIRQGQLPVMPEFRSAVDRAAARGFTDAERWPVLALSFGLTLEYITENRGDQIRPQSYLQALGDDLGLTRLTANRDGRTAALVAIMLWSGETERFEQTGPLLSIQDQHGFYYIALGYSHTQILTALGLDRLSQVSTIAKHLNDAFGSHQAYTTIARAARCFAPPVSQLEAIARLDYEPLRQVERGLLGLLASNVEVKEATVSYPQAEQMLAAMCAHVGVLDRTNLMAVVAWAGQLDIEPFEPSLAPGQLLLEDPGPEPPWLGLLGRGQVVTPPPPEPPPPAPAPLTLVEPPALEVVAEPSPPPPPPLVEPPLPVVVMSDGDQSPSYGGLTPENLRVVESWMVCASQIAVWSRLGVDSEEYTKLEDSVYDTTALARRPQVIAWLVAQGYPRPEELTHSVTTLQAVSELNIRLRQDRQVWMAWARGFGIKRALQDSDYTVRELEARQKIWRQEFGMHTEEMAVAIAAYAGMLE